MSLLSLQVKRAWPSDKFGCNQQVWYTYLGQNWVLLWMHAFPSSVFTFFSLIFQGSSRLQAFFIVSTSWGQSGRHFLFCRWEREGLLWEKAENGKLCLRSYFDSAAKYFFISWQMDNWKRRTCHKPSSQGNGTKSEQLQFKYSAKLFTVLEPQNRRFFVTKRFLDSKII